MISRWRQNIHINCNRPGFQGFGHQGVIGTTGRFTGDAPRPRPTQAGGRPSRRARIIRQAPTRVGIVQMHGNCRGRIAGRGPPREMARDHVLDRRADQKIFLLQSKRAPAVEVVRIQYPIEASALHAYPPQPA